MNLILSIMKADRRAFMVEIISVNGGSVIRNEKSKNNNNNNNNRLRPVCDASLLSSYTIFTFNLATKTEHLIRDKNEEYDYYISCNSLCKSEK